MPPVSSPSRCIQTQASPANTSGSSDICSRRSFYFQTEAFLNDEALKKKLLSDFKCFVTHLLILRFGDASHATDDWVATQLQAVLLDPTIQTALSEPSILKSDELLSALTKHLHIQSNGLLTCRVGVPMSGCMAVPKSSDDIHNQSHNRLNTGSALLATFTVGNGARNIAKHYSQHKEKTQSSNPIDQINERLASQLFLTARINPVLAQHPVASIALLLAQSATLDEFFQNCPHFKELQVLNDLSLKLITLGDELKSTSGCVDSIKAFCHQMREIALQVIDIAKTMGCSDDLTFNGLKQFMVIDHEASTIDYKLAYANLARRCIRLLMEDKRNLILAHLKQLNYSLLPLSTAPQVPHWFENDAENTIRCAEETIALKHPSLFSDVISQIKKDFLNKADVLLRLRKDLLSYSQIFEDTVQSSVVQLLVEDAKRKIKDSSGEGLNAFPRVMLDVIGDVSALNKLPSDTTWSGWFVNKLLAFKSTTPEVSFPAKSLKALLSSGCLGSSDPVHRQLVLGQVAYQLGMFLQAVRWDTHCAGDVAGVYRGFLIANIRNMVCREIGLTNPSEIAHFELLLRVLRDEDQQLLTDGSVDPLLIKKVQAQASLWPQTADSKLLDELAKELSHEIKMEEQGGMFVLDETPDQIKMTRFKN